MNKTISNLLRILMIFSILGSLTSCTIIKLVIYNTEDINDYKKFPSRNLRNDSIRFTFETSVNQKTPSLPESIKDENLTFEEFLKTHETIAFLIIQNDSVIYENYFTGYEKASVVPSFSMAKSILSILTGCAIDDGLIKSVNEPVTNYLPELKENGFDKVKIKHLLQMTSGIENKERNLIYLGKVYYGRNLWKIISKLKLDKEPGSEFNYLNENAQLLGFVLERALNGKTLTQYFQEKLWQPLGMEYDGSWSIDRKKNGTEKTFCCINACARDFAKIGRLYLNDGNWNGKQIVSREWVTNSLQSDTTDGSIAYYHYMWWLPTSRGDFMARGSKGQYVYVYPSKNLIIVRLGKNTGQIDWWNFFINLTSNY